MQHIALTSKLVRNVRTPVFELSVASMVNAESSYYGAAFAGELNTRSGIKSAYAGLFQPLVPTPASEVEHDGPCAGLLRKRLLPGSDDEVQRAADCARAAAHGIEYQLRTHGTQGGRHKFRANDFVAHSAMTDVEICEAKLKGAVEHVGATGTWLVATDARSDDAVDPSLERDLAPLLDGGIVPDIPPNVLPGSTAIASNAPRALEASGVAMQEPLELEVHVSNVGDGRGFGIKFSQASDAALGETTAGMAEPFSLRYYRDRATMLPGWHGGGTADVSRRTDDEAAAKAAPGAANPKTTAAFSEPLESPEEAEAAQQQSAVGGASAVHKLTPIDPLYHLNADFSFAVQEGQYRERRDRLVPLSFDLRPTRLEESKRIRRAGGVIDVARHAVSLLVSHRPQVGANMPVFLGNDEPCVAVSRAFGLTALKQQAELSAVDQIVTAIPEVRSWSMRHGDYIVLATHSLFDTPPGSDPLTVDAVAQIVIEAAKTHAAGVANRLADPATALDAVDPDGVCGRIAADLCDYAVRNGASRNVAVAVGRAREQAATAAQLLALKDKAAPKTGAKILTIEEKAKILNGIRNASSASTTVIPGPVYPGALRMSHRYCVALDYDCWRMDVDLWELLLRRYVMAAPLLRDVGMLTTALPMTDLTHAFPQQAGLLLGLMTDEAEFYRQCPFVPEDINIDAPTEAQVAYFKHLADTVVRESPAGRAQAAAEKGEEKKLATPQEAAAQQLQEQRGGGAPGQ